jgi:hypothetical protein
MSFAFRHRIHLTDPQLPLGADVELPLLQESTGERVVLRAIGSEGETLGNATVVGLFGTGYPTEVEARRAADRCRTVLERSFAAVGIAADFGDRTPTGINISTHLLTALSEAADGHPVMPERHSLVVFEETNKFPVFISMGARGYASPQRDTLMRAITSDLAAEPLTPAHRLAFELHAASFGSGIADARFMLLMMALETLIDQARRSADVRQHVEWLISETRKSTLDEEERRSLEGSLRWLYVESISQAGRRLVESLGDRMYESMTPVKFFTRCYDMRSKLAHGHVPRPTQEEVGLLAASLQVLVGQLIAGRELIDLLSPVKPAPA